jgi:lipopolysaccharide cholinephosphotransferase
MNELQSRVLMVGKEFKRVCDENNLRYFMDYGTFLGAVRHKGFIPWDDDMDFCMPRADYEKFLEIAPSCLGENFALRTAKYERKYPYVYAKLNDKRTTVITPCERKCGLKFGVFIDIFPLDNVPDGLKEREKFAKRCTRDLHIANLANMDLSERNYTGFKKLISKFCWLFDGEKRLEKFEKQLRRYNVLSTRDVSSNVTYGKGAIHAAKLFDESVEYAFEDTTFRGVKNYDEYLSTLYGDYMTPPPESKRTLNQHYAEYDLNKPCLP